MSATVAASSGHSAATCAGLPRPSQRLNAAATSAAAPSSTSARAKWVRVGASCAASRGSASPPGAPARSSRAAIVPARACRSAAAQLDRRTDAGAAGSMPEADDVHGAAAPARRELDAGDARESVPRGGGRASAWPATVSWSVSANSADAGRGEQLDERRRRQHAVGAGRVQVQVDAAAHARDRRPASGRGRRSRSRGRAGSRSPGGGWRRRRCSRTGRCGTGEPTVAGRADAPRLEDDGAVEQLQPGRSQASCAAAKATARASTPARHSNASTPPANATAASSVMGGSQVAVPRTRRVGVADEVRVDEGLAGVVAQRLAVAADDPGAGDLGDRLAGRGVPLRGRADPRIEVGAAVGDQAELRGAAERPELVRADPREEAVERLPRANGWRRPAASPRSGPAPRSARRRRRGPGGRRRCRPRRSSRRRRAARAARRAPARDGGSARC